jgi:short-subunit dehydrogenase
VQGFAEALAVELRPEGLSVLSVAPGPVGTGFRAHRRLGVVVIAFLALVERLQLDSRNNPRLKAHAPQGSTDKMGAETRFHPDDAGRALLERA